MQLVRIEQDIVERARQGEINAFQKLFDYYQTPVYNFVVRMIGREQDAEDVVQEIFVKIYQKLPSLREAQYFTTWMFSIARNETITYVRKYRRRQMDSIDGEDSTQIEKMMVNDHKVNETPDRLASDNELQKLMQAALSEVPEMNRAAFILGVIEGYSYKEVAQMLGCTENNVKTRVFRARAAISQKLRPYFQAVS